MLPDKQAELIRITSQRLIDQLFPTQAPKFQGVWEALLPIVQAWTRLMPSRRRFDVEALVSTPGLGVQPQQFSAMCIAVMVLVATMLEMLEFQRSPKTEYVLARLRAHSRSFKAPPYLREMLEQSALDLCMGVFAVVPAIPAAEDNARQPEDSTPPEQADIKGGYGIPTDTETREGLTYDEVLCFLGDHRPGPHGIWISDVEPAVFYGTKRLDLGRQARIVLALLVLKRGYTMPHNVIVQTCGAGRHDYERQAKTVGRWIGELRKALDAVGVESQRVIGTREGGYAYEGPPSFCIIAHTNRLRRLGGGQRGTKP
jgi:hypothetical protein